MQCDRGRGVSVPDGAMESRSARAGRGNVRRLGVGLMIPLIYLVWSMRYGRIAEANPWRLPGLEWQTASPPPTENFIETPIVTSEAYEFAGPEHKEVIGKFERQRPAEI